MEPRTGIDLASLRRLQQEQEALQPGELFSYSEELRSVMVSPVHICSPEDDLEAAIGTMAREGISSLVAVDLKGDPVGIVTERDVLRTIAGVGGCEIDRTPVSQVMTPNLLTLAPGASVYRALFLLYSTGVKHLPLVEDGRLAGIVTLRQLLKLSYPQPMRLIEAIAGAADLEALREIKARLPQLAASRLSRGMHAYDVVAMISLINQDLHRKAFEFALGETGLPPATCCLFLTGSHGRMENLLVTDQDYGLIIADGAGDAAEADAYFAAAAETFTAHLETLGFERCPGQVMATNPVWRQSLAGWKRQLDHWFKGQVPKLGRYVTVLFDAIPVWGDGGLFRELDDYAFDLLARHHEVFRILHEEEAGHRVPTRLLGGFVTERSGVHRGKIDIKRSGLIFVVEAVRILALRHGVRETSTLKRLAALADRGYLHADDGEYYQTAFRFLQYFALDSQVKKAVAGEQPDTWLNPKHLSPLHRQMLRQAYKAVTALQGTVATEFGELVL